MFLKHLELPIERLTVKIYYRIRLFRIFYISDDRLKAAVLNMLKTGINLFFSFYFHQKQRTFFALIIHVYFFINSLLATFNLLPFGPLDGMKIIRWNGIVWSFLLISSIILLFLNFQRGLAFPSL